MLETHLHLQYWSCTNVYSTPAMSAAVENTNCVIPSGSLYFTTQEGVFPPLTSLMYWPLMLVLLFLGILATVSQRGHWFTGDNSLLVMLTLFTSFSTTKWLGPAVIRVMVSSPIFMCKDFEGRNHFLVLAHSSCLILLTKIFVECLVCIGCFSRQTDFNPDSTSARWLFPF